MQYSSKLVLGKSNYMNSLKGRKEQKMHYKKHHYNVNAGNIKLKCSAVLF